VDPDIGLSSGNFADCEKGAGVWYFSGLITSLCELQERQAERELERLARTAVSGQIEETLDFCRARRRWVLIEGISGIGKSETVKSFCRRHAGEVRYVEVPSSNDDRSFYANIAEALGVARGLSFNTQQIKLRVEEMLSESGLMLVLDEAQFLIPAYARPRGIPSRLQWLKTAFDAGTPLALCGLPDFSKWQQLYVERTMWSDEQLERRINRKTRLPDIQLQEDFMRIAQAHFPEGDKTAWRLLAGYALASPKKQASAITEALESARYMAEIAGRDAVTFEDISAVIHQVHIPSDHGDQPQQEAPRKASAMSVQGGCAGDAETLSAIDLQGSPRGGVQSMPEPLRKRATQESALFTP
jgi:hypothetical protein